MGGSEILEWTLSGGILAVIGWTFVRSTLDTERRARLRLRARRRAPRAERAALEAALDDPVFSPELVHDSVKTILEMAQSVWQGGETAALRRRRDLVLIRSWAKNRAKWLGGNPRLVGAPKVDILQVVNRESESEDRVITRVRFRVDRGPGLPVGGRRVHLDERWTLSHRRGEWSLVSVAGDPLAGPALSAPLITSPSADTERLGEASLRELAGESSGSSIALADLVDTGAPPEQQLRELSVIDDRFSPLLLAATLTHIVEAWEEASDGSEAPLREVATKQAARSLFYPGGPGGRQFIRDAKLEHWKAVRVDLKKLRPSVTVAVNLKAACFRSDGRKVSGDDRKRRELDLVWTLELAEGDGHEPRWRLALSEE
jgi:predicted lipid-binding transport protein (Tim44 family)